MIGETCMNKKTGDLILTCSKVTLIAAAAFAGMVAHADSWVAVTGEKELKALYSDVVQEGALTNKAK